MEYSFEQFDPFRTPHWRFERVLEMVDRLPTPGRSTRRDDKYVKGLRTFILKYRRYDRFACHRLCSENPGLYFAWMLHIRAEEEPETLFIIQARILARQSDKDIADEFHTMPETIEWYEKLFYNVRDRFDAHDWILRTVLVPAIMESKVRLEQEAPEGRLPRSPLAEPFFDSSIKMFGYFGGPIAIDFMLSGFRRDLRLQTNEDVGPWMNEFIMQSAKRRCAMAVGQFEVNKYNVMELFAFFGQIVTIEKSSDHEDQSRTQIETSIQAMMGQIVFAMGREGAATVEGTAIAAFDSGPVELRDAELLRLHSGEEIDTLEELEDVRIPEPRKKDDEDEDAKQVG